MHELLQSLGEIGASLMTAAAILAASLGIGVGLLRALRLELDSAVERATWSISLGLIAGGMAIALLGLLGVLYRPLVGLLTVCGATWGIVCLHLGWLSGKFQHSVQRDSPFDAETSSSPPVWLWTTMFLLAVVVGCSTFVCALAPPTAGDALCYHLELPKAFLAQHGLGHLPFHDNSTFPLLGEMWFLWGLALEGPVAAQLLCWCSGWLLAGATFSLARPLLGRGWSEIAALAVVLIPGVNNHMAAPLVDVPTALLTTLMLAAWQRTLAGDDERSWSIVAGCCLGAACGAKYVGLVWAAAWCCVVAWQAWLRREQWRTLLAHAGMVLTIAASLGGIWYVRAAYHRGNPVFPFLSAWLPGAIPPPESVDKTPLALTPLSAVTAPWQVTLFPERFGGRGHRLGVLPLLLLPALLTARRLRGLGPILALASCYALGWYVLRQNTRFLYPAAPLFVLAATWSVIELWRWPAPARRMALALVGLVIAVDTLGPLRRAAAHLPVACSWESREDFLLRSEPTYRAACVANAMLPSDARILSQDYRAFYFDARVTRESIFRRATNYPRLLAGRGLSPALRQLGFTHLLLVESRGSNGAGFDPTLSQLVDAAQAAEKPGKRRLACLDEYEITDPDGAQRNYRLIELR